jgi:hypothetical protein
MKRWCIVWSVCVLAVLGPSCSGGTGGSAMPPVDPFGTEPTTVGGSEPAGTADESGPSGGASIADLCAQVCAHLAAAMCPSSPEDASCVASCTTTDIQGCDAQVKAFLACVATAPLTCANGGISAPACDATETALQACMPSGT